MKKWIYKVRIRYLFTEEEDHRSIQKVMNATADVLSKHACFNEFNISKFRKIPKGDDFFAPVDYSTRVLDEMYDYADAHRIWIE